MLGTQTARFSSAVLRRGLDIHLLAASTSTHRVVAIQVRALSASDVFGRVDLNKVADLPAAPLPPLPRPSLDELIGSGHSVLEELGLWSWYKPSSWFRWGLESVHLYADIPWWATIVASTIVLRLCLIRITVTSQKVVAKQSKYKPELAQFRDRINAAKAENNSMLIQQVLVEQRDFLRSKDIRLGRQFLVLLTNGGVFMTNFFALRGMTRANYPGFEAEGALWFNDLIAADPYYVLPIISGLTLAAVVRLGVESGASADQLSPAIRAGMQYALPLIVVASSSQFASAMCVYWCTSNMVSLAYAGLFRIQPVRDFFNIPPLVRHETPEKSLRASWSDYKARRDAPPRIEALRKKDAEQFKKAGRGKPIVS